MVRSAHGKKTGPMPPSYPLADMFCDASGPAIDWLQDDFGLALDVVSRMGGHSNQRTRRTKSGGKFPGCRHGDHLGAHEEVRAVADPCHLLANASCVAVGTNVPRVGEAVTGFPKRSWSQLALARGLDRLPAGPRLCIPEKGPKMAKKECHQQSLLRVPASGSNASIHVFSPCCALIGYECVCALATRLCFTMCGCAISALPIGVTGGVVRLNLVRLNTTSGCFVYVLS